MLDSPHKTILKAVARGDDDVESPALQNLVATGLVAADPSKPGGHRVTDAGQAAIAAGVRSRGYMIALWVAAVSGVIVVGAELVEWLA